VRADTTNSQCARCGAAFRCGVNDPEPCACGTLKLDVATLALLRAKYGTCLCMACLHALSAARHEPETKKAGPV
jgi:Cysteine-rich CWC